jgi:hypothetical protein
VWRVHMCCVQSRIWPDLLEGVEVFQRAVQLRGSGGNVSQDISEIWSLEMPFPAFWALR